MIISKKDLNLIKRALKYAQPFKFRLFAIFICISSGIAFGLIQPFLWAKLLTSLYKRQADEHMVK